MTLAQLRKVYKDGFTVDTDITMHTDETHVSVEISIFNGSYYQNSVICHVDKKDKKELYELLAKLYEMWDFSYLLQFNSVDEIKTFMGA